MLECVAGCASAPSAASGPEWKPIGKRKARVVLWGVTHNHAKGKFDALKRLKDDYEIVGIVDNSASKVMRMAEPKMKNYKDYLPAAKKEDEAPADPAAEA